MKDLVLLTGFVLLVLGFLAWYVWSSWGSGVGEVDVLETVGSLGKWETRIAHVGNRRMVQLILGQQGDGGEVEVQMFLTASEARLLSQWLRVAAARGRRRDQPR